MDPVTLATITAGVSVLATESAKGLAGQAGKDTWARIKSALGWKDDPAPEKLAPAIAERLANDDDTARTVINLLRDDANSVGSAAAIVGSINAERVIVIKDQTVTGDLNIQM
jgi:hypothetical protein